MKKFYRHAEAGTAPGGFVVRLDGKPVKTPLGHILLLQSGELARKMAEEWEGQKEIVVPASMPLTQLANTLADKAEGADRAAMEGEIVRYASSDLVCYFAAHPADLVAMQEESWLPLIDWLREEFGVVLETVKGIQYKNQQEEAMERVKEIACGLGSLEFTVVQAALAVTGSAVIALALMKGRINAQAAYRAACVDEIYQLEKWGEDAQARGRLERIKAELESIETFMKLCSTASS